VQGVTHALIVLESKLRVAQAMGVITSEVLQVIDNEIDSVLRALAKYSHEDQLLAERNAPAPAPVKPARRAPAPPPQPVSSSAGIAAASSSDQASRRARILTIIEAKGEVSIKDITDIITDVSEKTIQRELNAMIEDNQIKRIGERRWSRYVLF
jgi:predicted HTH transcriptional regulator